MARLEAYDLLVNKRKHFQFSEGLRNPSQIDGGIHDLGNHLGPWSAWQGNLDAKILLIGQDWGDVNYYRDNKGYDTDSNPTCKNLVKLFNAIGIDIGLPSRPNKLAPTFFTNAILGMKESGGMSGKVLTKWVNESTENFLIPLLQILQPEIIVTLGTVAYKALAEVYSLPINPLKVLIQNNPVQLDETINLYAMYHCGGLGLANRPLLTQMLDWQKIKLE